MNAIKGGVIPGGFIPAVEKGVQEAMQAGVVAGYPVKGVRVQLFDGQHHSVDSSEMAFKIAGLDGVQGRDGAGPARADGADHDRERARARGLRGRRDR